MDRVQVIIRESSATGGNSAEEEDLPRPLDPQEDAPEVAGLFIQSATARDEKLLITRDVSDRMVFTDNENPSPLTLTQLLTNFPFDNYVFSNEGGFVYTDDMVPVTRS